MRPQRWLYSTLENTQPDFQLKVFLILLIMYWDILRPNCVLNSVVCPQQIHLILLYPIQIYPALAHSKALISLGI